MLKFDQSFISSRRRSSASERRYDLSTASPTRCASAASAIEDLQIKTHFAGSLGYRANGVVPEEDDLAYIRRVQYCGSAWPNAAED